MDRPAWDEIAADAAHRPWPLPSRPWAMTMSWHDLLFAHWPVPADLLRPLVPPVLPLDTFDGRAWIGVVPFRMSDVSLRRVPPLPWLSAFPEINVRTYTTLENKPGVFFFSLDATNPLAVWGARAFFHLPYFRARIEITRLAGEHRAYRVERTHRQAPPALFDASYEPTGARYRSGRGDLDHFLTERYCLYTVGRDGSPRRVEIQHRPWPLQPAAAELRLNAMGPIALPAREPLLHFAERLDVVAWLPEAVG